MHFTWFEHVLNMLNMLNMKNCNWTWQKKKRNFTVDCMFSMIRLCKHALNIPEHAQTWLNMKIRFLNMLLYKIKKKHWTWSYMLWTARDMPSTCYCPLALPFEKVGPRGSSMFSVFGMVESMFSMFRHVQHVLFMFFVWKEVVHAKNMHFTWFEHVLNMLNMLNMKNCNWTWQKKKRYFTVDCMFSMIRLCKHALNIPKHAQTWLNMMNVHFCTCCCIVLSSLAGCSAAAPAAGHCCSGRVGHGSGHGWSWSCTVAESLSGKPVTQV